MTPALAIDNAARLLLQAEMTTDLGLMQRLDEMAATWVHMASLLCEHTDAQAGS